MTIFRSPEEVLPGGQLPAPLAALGNRVEVEVRPAPGDRGAELRVRLRRPEPAGIGGMLARLSGKDPRQQVRGALREAKQLIEVGEVLRLDPTPHGPRRATLSGRLIEFVARRSSGEGVL